VICETCKSEGKRSKVFVEGSMSTTMGASQFYDEDGRYHYHDPNTHSTSYHCSEGHHWTKGIQMPCSGCYPAEVSA
jgi:hypothetical protein